MLTRMVSITWPRDPPASASQNAGIIGVSHCAQPFDRILTNIEWSKPNDTLRNASTIYVPRQWYLQLLILLLQCCVCHKATWYRCRNFWVVPISSGLIVRDTENRDCIFDNRLTMLYYFLFARRIIVFLSLFFLFLRQSLALPPSLECSGEIPAHCTLCLLDSSYLPVSASQSAGITVLQEPLCLAPIFKDVLFASNFRLREKLQK